MDNLKQKSNNFEISQPSVPRTVRENAEVLFLRQTIERLQHNRTLTASQSISKGSAWLFKQIAGHVLILVLGISLTAWWMLNDDSWKSYVQTGCNPSPLLYSQRFVPEHPKIKDGATWGELVEHQQSRITQLIVINSQLNLDRDSVRAACANPTESE